tara:strand:+ start:7493 stop:8161 length:669 start_codon:yes stop_codon:yes gene_type:complete
MVDMLKGFERLDIKEMNVADLVEDPDNVNMHSDQDLDATEASLNKFNQLETLIVDADTNTVIGGNGRLRIMKRNGWDKVMVWPVRGTPDQLKALGITLNKTPRNSEFDYQKLIGTLRELQDADEELLHLTGFPEHELTPLLDSEMDMSAGFDDADLDTDESSVPGTDLESRGMVVQFSVPQKTIVDEALANFRAVAEDAGQPPAEILTIICSKYISSRDDED